MENIYLPSTQKKKKNHGSLHPWMLSMCKWSEFMAIHKRNSEFVKNLKFNNNINYIKFYHLNFNRFKFYSN